MRLVAPMYHLHVKVSNHNVGEWVIEGHSTLPDLSNVTLQPPLRPTACDETATMVGWRCRIDIRIVTFQPQ